MSEFIPLFDLSQSTEIQQFIKKYGYVVIKDILTPAECDATTEDVNQQIKANDS